MSGFKINFTPKPLDEIAPFGEPGKHSLSWFGLTDGWLWITAGSGVVYEYSNAAAAEWGGGRYNDYYLSRFLEDFSDIFGSISQSVSREIYNSVEDFEEHSAAMLDKVPDNPDNPDFESKLAEYLAQTQWFRDRVFDSGHLIGGPLIGCFRCGDDLKFYWKSDYVLENGESIWAYPRGALEMSYADFVTEVKRFFAEFHARMDEQVKRALEKDWGEVRLDKDYLVRENAERKTGFAQKIALL